VNVSEAKQMIESNPDLAILDVRNLEEYESGHIENAVLIPVTELEERIDELDKEKETLVYCRSGGRSATAGQILVDTGFSSVYNMLGGIMAWRNAGYWIEIIHKGDLIIDGTQTYLIENCTFIQTGDVMVKDYAELSIKNATLILNGSFVNQYGIIAENHGTLQMENAIVKGKNGFYLTSAGNTKVNMNLTRVDDWLYCSGASTITVARSTIQVFAISDQSTVSVTDSTISHLYFMPSAIINIDNLKPGFSQYWSLRENQTYTGEADITLEKTMVNHWSFTFNHDAIITNSTLSFDCDWADINDISILAVSSSVESVGLRLLGGYEVTIDDLSPRFYEHYELSEHAQGIRTNLVFQRTMIAGWHLWAGYDTVVTLTNSTIEGLKCTENSRITLNNSIIDSPQNWDALWFSNYSGIIVFEQSVINDGIRILTSDFLVEGDITFTEDAYIDSWEYTNITRDFNIIVLNKTVPSENVSLTLYSQNNTIICSGLTDTFGKSNFNLTFTDNNYTDTVRLEAVKGNFSAIMNVSFLSDTPIILTMRYFADLNGDGTVNIFDLFIIAKAFRTKEGDENWNPIADLDDNKEINIIDLYQVATNFGKTF
jgi:rhodanese-related sulfurtransferase